ncbi:forkhead box protein R1 [Sorex araneus]|uniref:forkhead box protein R1 n=1 Tax=Sorex araneus TaxID=42254 RepID=UPI0024340362|nr:forkhead box protein R1 [Sorex araneus]
MANEVFLACTTEHLPPTQQNLARYRLRIFEPPALTLNRGANFKDGEEESGGPCCEPNPWMWVNPNIVLPAGELGATAPVQRERLTSPLPSPQRPPKDKGLDSCSEVMVESPPPSSSEKSPPPKRMASSPSPWELTEEEAEAEDQDDSSPVALLSPHKRVPLQSQTLRHTCSQEGPLWARPPLNYFHLIALALRNSAPCGLNVQQIYSFTRQHFPFFRTAPEGWKNTIRHNLCFRDSFEKVPVGPEDGASPRPRCCLWKLTEKGHARFLAEVHALAATRLRSIRKCMSQPDVMPFLFDL